MLNPPNLLFLDASEGKALFFVCSGELVVFYRESSVPGTTNRFFVEAYQQAFHDFNPSNLEGIVVCNGPGSYSGLRVALSFAKGIAAGLKIPIVPVSKLDVMIESMKMELSGTNQVNPEAKYAPMVDARRMEIYGCLQQENGEFLLVPGAYVLDEPFFLQNFTNSHIYFAGSGAVKVRQMIEKVNGTLVEMEVHYVDALKKIGFRSFNNGAFGGWDELQPFYLKDFYQPIKKKLG